MKFLRIVLALFFLSGVILIHEIGHLIELAKKEVEIEAVVIGWDFGIIPTLKFYPKALSGVTLKISPLIIGGYVAIADEGQKLIKTMSYQDFAAIYGGGIYANLLAGLCLLILAIIIQKRSFKNRLKKFLFLSGPIVFLLVAKNAFYVCLIPLISLALSVSILASLTKRAFKPTLKERSFKLIGILGLIRSLSTTKDISDTILKIGIVSLSVGIFNLFPILPLDGSRIVQKLIAIKFSLVASHFSWISLGVLTLIFGLLFIADIREYKQL